MTRPGFDEEVEKRQQEGTGPWVTRGIPPLTTLPPPEVIR